MDPQYEIVIFRRNGLFSDLERFIFGDSFGMRVRQLGEKLTLPRDVEIVDSSGYFSEAERSEKTKEYTQKYKIN